MTNAKKYRCAPSDYQTAALPPLTQENICK
jgi:hypothetical protein